MWKERIKFVDILFMKSKVTHRVLILLQRLRSTVSISEPKVHFARLFMYIFPCGVNNLQSSINLRILNYLIVISSLSKVLKLDVINQTLLC